MRVGPPTKHAHGGHQSPPLEQRNGEGQGKLKERSVDVKKLRRATVGCSDFPSRESEGEAWMSHGTSGCQRSTGYQTDTAHEPPTPVSGPPAPAVCSVALRVGAGFGH